MTMRSRLKAALFLILSTATLALISQEVFALITGGEGNTPLRDPGWPAGAAAIFNTPSRIAWWEGPPFGGGQWHAECRGDAQALSAALADFAKLDVKTKRGVLHDGVGRSFWLNPNDEPAKREAARMDWRFMVWQVANGERLRELPTDLNPTDPEDADDGPPSQMDVSTGGNVRWADVLVPEGLKVVDQRLEAHGFTPADGVVLEGKVTDLATNKPVAANVRLERVDPQPNCQYRYTKVAGTVADAKGRWVLKHAPEGWHRVVIEADGFVPRVAGYAKFEGQPHWRSYDAGLARPASVTGRVTDDAGRPLADVEVRIQDVTTSPGGRYESPLGYSFQTGTDGRFRANQVPVGQARISVHKPGYTRPGLSQPITTPQENVELRMIQAGRIVVTVDFTGNQRPEAYIVGIEPEEGEAVGRYGGSGHIDAKNQIGFENVPPGRYTLRGQPNPSSADQVTEAVTVEVTGGETAQVKLAAK
jgi:Carboxypeptidase regulatory-like domain